MRRHGDTPSWHDTSVRLAAISPPGVAQGRFFGSHQSGLAECKPSRLFMHRAPSCSVTGDACHQKEIKKIRKTRLKHFLNS